MLTTMNIAVLGNSTTDYFSAALVEECGKHEIHAQVYNSPYNQYTQEILDSHSGLYDSKPELIIIQLEGSQLFTAWYQFQTLQQSKEFKSALLNNVFEELTAMLEKIHSLCNAKIILQNFKVPYYSPLGILDHKYTGLKWLISSLNILLEEYAATRDYLYIFDYNGLAAQFGYRQAEDPKMFYIAKKTLSLPFTKILAREYMRYILPLKSKNKKCLVLDLDNTLWGGIAGEDGLDGIKLDISGTGRSFYDFQQEILALYQKGIILAINSKNNYPDAMEIIENHPYMLLRKKHFAALKINWQDKAANIREIAKELNIGIDSMVFFDDNPIEREYVRSVLPEVTVVNVPEDTSKYVQVLQDIVDFELLSITEEDRKRNEMYKINQERLESQKQFATLEEYLASIGSEVTIEYANQYSIPRIAQLTQKTNQFNMTTARYRETDIQSMVSTGSHLVLSCSVKDKYGDNGLVGVCIIKPEGSSAAIDTFLLSCRVLGRNIEYAFLSAVITILRGLNIQTIDAKYVRTEKNTQNRAFYENAGFTKVLDSEEETIYRLDAVHEVKNFEYIHVIISKEATNHG